MILVEEARQRMMACVRNTPIVEPALDPAEGFAARDLVAPTDHPLFDMSAVDGYAFAFSTDISAWTVRGAIAAGGTWTEPLASGECVRIFTGAMLPADADTVVMQEAVQREGDRITHADTRLKCASNVRKRGDQIRSGDVLIRAGEPLNAIAKGLLASAGVRSVPVFGTPRVRLLITGDEFLKEGLPTEGRIHGSNDVLLRTLLRAEGIDAVAENVADDPEHLQQRVRAAVGESDVVISTGGASVGDHDLVRAAVEHCDGTVVFHGVRQKPGKPMLFAMIDGKPFFGLPGNPRAVAVLFWEYVLPFLRAMRGAREPSLRMDLLPIAHPIGVKPDTAHPPIQRAEFRAARVENGQVVLLADEGSHMLRSLLTADALAYLPAGKDRYEDGDRIEVHYLPR